MRLVTAWLAVARGGGPPTAMLQAMGEQNAVEARLTGQISSLIRQRRDDLRGRQAGKFRSADKVEHAFALGLAQRIGRRRTRGFGAPSLDPRPKPDRALPDLPAAQLEHPLHRVLVEPQQVATVR